MRSMDSLPSSAGCPLETLLLELETVLEERERELEDE